MTKLETLIEQTSFLLEKQKEAQKECASIFAELVATATARKNELKGNKEEFETLEQVENLLAEQAERLNEEAQVDIDFLDEQYQALSKIKSLNNPTKEQELLGMLLDESEEIKDTEAFKKEVTEESTISKQNLLTMTNDIKDAIKEGSAQDVALYLESLLDEDGGDIEGGDDEDADLDEDEDGCCEDDCDDCSGCCGGDKDEESCCGSVDIFSKIEEEVDKESNKTTH
jgi:hypothetical protein